MGVGVSSEPGHRNSGNAATERTTLRHRTLASVRSSPPEDPNQPVRLFELVLGGLMKLLTQLLYSVDRESELGTSCVALSPYPY
jgi:hypothetical protein